MSSADRIVYAERQLTKAQQDVVDAQRSLSLAMRQAQDGIDQANRELVAPGALIAEFGGKLYVSLRSAGFDIRHEVEEFAVRAVVSGRTGHLRCECGEAGEWDARGGGAVVASRHWHSGSVEGRKPNLTIVRTALKAPLCEHWLHVPLKMDYT